MAVVPYRVSGRAADQDLQERLIQIGPHLISIEQASISSVAFSIAHAPIIHSRIQWVYQRARGSSDI